MKKIYFFSNSSRQIFLKTRWLQAAMLFLFAFTFHAQAQVKQWEKTIGGDGTDILHATQQTSDGGYILGGYTSSGIGGDKTEATDFIDYWIVKIDANGNKEWDKTYGGDGVDILHAVKQTRDGGYIMGGYSSSGISGDKSAPKLGSRAGSSDFWVIKVDAAGNKEWDKAFGGAYEDYFMELDLTKDGGYVLGGDYNYGIDEGMGEAPGADSLFLVVKIDSKGNTQWERGLGSENGINSLTALKQTNDGGYILGGFTTKDASGDKSEDSRGYSDYWVVKLDAAGNQKWDKTYGGSSFDELYDLAQTPDGGYILGGSSNSDVSGDKTAPSNGNSDYWIVKLNANGNKEWDQTIGGNGSDDFRSLDVTSDGGYILGGHSSSGISGEKSDAHLGQSDYWVVKLNTAGKVEWDRTYGREDTDYLNSVFQTRDGGYLLAGHSDSGTSRDKSEASEAGYSDFWVIKLEMKAITPPLPPTDAVCGTLTFEEIEKGLLSTINMPEGPVTIMGRKRDENGSYTSGNYAAIFDSQTPTGDDSDLYTTTWGNVLIINQDQTTVPNDNQWGGELILDFSAIGPVTMESLNAIDIDNYENMSWVYLYDAAGNELYKVQLKNLGNNSKQTVDLGNTAGVMQMRVVLDGRNEMGNFAGSGAIDNIKYCVESITQESDDMHISEVSGYPNPFTVKASIEFKLLQNENYAVSLYNIQGHLIRELKTGEGRAGELNVVEVDGKELMNGIYLVKIVSGSSSKTIKLILNK